MKYNPRRLAIKLVLLVSLLDLSSSGCAPLVVGAAAGGAGGVVSSAKAAKEEHHSTGAYIGSVLANVPYFPAKVIFAGGGSIASGLVYMGSLGNWESAKPIWNASVMGNYLVTPNMIDGEERARFVGP